MLMVDNNLILASIFGLLILGLFLLIGVIVITGIKNSFPGSGKPDIMIQKLILLTSQLVPALSTTLGIYLVVLALLFEASILARIVITIGGIVLIFQNDSLRQVLNKNPTEVKQSFLFSIFNKLGFRQGIVAKYKGSEINPRVLERTVKSDEYDGLSQDPHSLKKDLKTASKVDQKSKDAIFRIGLRAANKTFFSAGNLKVDSENGSMQWDEN